MFAKKIKQFAACFCAVACITTMFAPAAPTQAATSTSSVESLDLTTPFGTTVSDFSKSTTSTTGTYTLPVYSTVNDSNFAHKF